MKAEERSTMKAEDNTYYGASSRLMNTSNRLVTSGLEIGTENMKVFNEYLLKLTIFNMGVMRMWWIPFLYFAKPSFENKVKA